MDGTIGKLLPIILSFRAYRASWARYCGRRHDLKELMDLEPLANFLSKILKDNGRSVVLVLSPANKANAIILMLDRAVFVNLHPCFHKPAAHRVMELFENTESGHQEQRQWIRVNKYLGVKPVQSQALRGQSQPLVCCYQDSLMPVLKLTLQTWFHHTIQDLLNPFAAASLAIVKD